jgi:hypothetical protein
VSDHLNVLLTEAVNLAETFLEKGGEFYPFAVALAPDGEVVHVQGWVDEKQPQPESHDVIAVLHRGLRKGVSDGAYNSTAVVSDVKLRDRESGDQGDAIRVEIEDCESSPITCFVPYSIKAGAIETRDVVSVPGKSVVFGTKTQEV